MRVALCAAIGAVCLCASVASPETGRSLTLSAAVETALASHASVAISDTQVRQAESALTVARSDFRPQLLGNWEYTFSDARGGRRFTTLGGIPVGVGGSQERHQSTLAGSYTVFDSGLRKARLREARATLDRADSSRDLALVDLTYQVAADYSTLLLEQRAAELARERVSQAQAHLALVEATIQAGLAAEVDRFPLQAELAQAQLSLVTAANRARQASIVLRNTIGLSAGEALAGEEPPAIPDIAGLPSVEDALAAAHDWRPDLREAEAGVSAAVASLEQSRVTARPLLSVGATYLWKVEPAPSGRDFVLDAQLSFPIFDAGARRAQTVGAKQGLDSAQLRLSQLQKDAAAQVAQARLAVTTAWERINAAEVSVNAARRSLESAEGRYAAGQAITIEITDAQVTYYNAQLDAASARYDYLTALAALRRSVGLPTRGFENLTEARLLEQ